ncbi:hypothetical protein ACS0TY_033369 [Phlomoides rotata]
MSKMEFSRVDLSDLRDLAESFSNLEIVDLVNVRANNVGEAEIQNPASTTTDASSFNIPTGNPGVNYMAPVPQRRNRAHDPFHGPTNSPRGKTALDQSRSDGKEPQPKSPEKIPNQT